MNALAALLALVQAPPADSAGLEFFEKRIRPVLVERCYECHSVGAKRVRGALFLDTREGLRKGGNMGAAVVAGNVDGSLLIQALRYHDEDLAMPPKEKLPDAVVKDFETWVAMGAPDPRDAGKAKAAGPAPVPADRLWSFRPVLERVPPAVRDAAWPANEIDRFILAGLERKGLRPAPAADRRTLLRRATLDLTGLPPTPEEVEAFVNDAAPGAWERVVERLLASPRYGERWGRHWLDVVRYADTSGDASDTPVPEARLYRDYVIDAFNRDMPYDEFVVEQLAGDRLAFDAPGERFEERIIATGFLALTRRFNNSKYGDMHLVIENTIDTVGKAFLGMSVACARCHDHKFDPIRKEDYYGFYGYFASTQYPHAGTEHGRGRDNLVPLTAERAEFEKARAWLNRWAELYNGWRKEGKKDAQGQLREHEKARPAVAWAWAVVDQPKPGDERVQLAGDPNRKGETARRGFLSGLTPAPAEIPEGQSGRLQLARWIASAENPLTARVMANRIWQQHFGTGIVPTANTFGSQGRAPTHPELLDWLAARFVKEGWSVKAMHRLLLRSAAYRQSSEAAPETAAADPSNELFGRFARRRLEWEALRDGFLALSGRLDLSRGGAHPFPAEDEMNFTQHRPFLADYDHARRSVYLMVRRLGKHPFMQLFDAPDSNVSTAERRVSTVPLQGLFLMNSPFLRETSEAFAARVRAGGADDPARVREAYRLAFGRDPDSAEEREALDYLGAYRKELAGRNLRGDPEALAWASLGRVLLSSSEFFYIE